MYHARLVCFFFFIPVKALRKESKGIKFIGDRLFWLCMMQDFPWQLVASVPEGGTDLTERCCSSCSPACSAVLGHL